MHPLALVFALSGGPLHAPPAEPPPPAAPDDVEARAQALVEQGRLGDALTLLGDAYNRSPTPRPRLLFGMGIIELERDRCEAAVGYLGRFLASDPPAAAATRAREVITYCDEQLRARADAKARVESIPPALVEPDTSEVEGAGSPPSGPTATTRDAAADAPVDRTPTPAHWSRDPMGGALAGSGVAFVGVGAGILAQAAADLRRARRASDEATFDRDVARGSSLRIVGAVLVGSGAGLLVGAFVRYGMVAKRNRMARLVPMVGGRLVGLTAAGRF